MRRALLFTFLLICSLSADVFDQVKPALNKPETSSCLRGIINLDQRPENMATSYPIEGKLEQIEGLKKF